jgi:hypothetical protein
MNKLLPDLAMNSFFMTKSLKIFILLFSISFFILKEANSQQIGLTLMNTFSKPLLIDNPNTQFPYSSPTGINQFGFGLEVNIPINKQLSLTTGANLLTLGYRMNQDINLGINIGSTSTSFKAEFFDITIPLWFNVDIFRLGNKKATSIFLQSGFSVDYWLQSGSGAGIISRIDGVVRADFPPSSFREKIGSSLGLGVGMNVNLTHHLRLRLGARYQYSLQTMPQTDRLLIINAFNSGTEIKIADPLNVRINTFNFYTSFYFWNLRKK